MSLFERLGTPQKKRKFLFWWVCIEVRFLLALSFFLSGYFGPSALILTSASLLVFISVSFLLQRFYLDNNYNIWWNRVAHAFFYFLAAVFTFLTYFLKNKNWAFGTLSVLISDLIFGIISAHNHTWYIEVNNLLNF